MGLVWSSEPMGRLRVEPRSRSFGPRPTALRLGLLFAGRGKMAIPGHETAAGANTPCCGQRHLAGYPPAKACHGTILGRAPFLSFSTTIQRTLEHGVWVR